MTAPDPPRRCGPCQACCTLPAQGPPLDVPAFTRCPHQQEGEAGCAIYAERPGYCRAFSCKWLLGWGEEDDRPDRMGLVLASAEGLALRPGEPPYLRVWEVWSDARRAPRPAEVLAAWRKQALVRLVKHGGETELLVQPPPWAT